MKHYDILPASKIPLTSSQLFTYSSLLELERGDLVSLPLGKGKTVGLVMRESTKKLEGIRVREVENILYPQYLKKEQIAVLGWMSRHYHASAGLILKIFLTGFSTTKHRLTQTESSKTTLLPPPKLTPEQETARKAITDTMDKEHYQGFLLFGITGSGKTEIYLHAVMHNYKRQRQSLILIPEIALTPQVVQRFQERFGEHIYVYHSRLTPRERREVLLASKNDKGAIVIGPRSALFLPYDNLGIIILDEEQDQSYKQFDKMPRYDARDVAERFAKHKGIPLVYGSATPRITTFYRAKHGELALLTLSKRISEFDGDIPMPSMKIIDLGHEIRSKNISPISRHLAKEMRHTLEQHEQVLLFLNRRGFATSVICILCKHVILCKRCTTPLVLHGSELICHQCGYHVHLPSRCPSCGSVSLKTRGIGTERIESMIRRDFPDARVFRADRDTMKHRKDYATLYNNLVAHKIDILIGTQMIAQGLDLPRVQLVGIIQTDNAINLPDYHAEEHVYQILSQVAGRAGRRKKQGKVIIQTFFPEHPLFQSLLQHNYQAFYEREVALRKELNYPPFSHTLLLRYGHKDPKVAENEALRFAELLQNKNISFTGPSPAFIMKVRNRWNWQIMVRIKNIEQFPFDVIPDSWDIDVDPQNVL